MQNVLLIIVAVVAFAVGAAEGVHTGTMGLAPRSNIGLRNGLFFHSSKAESMFLEIYIVCSCSLRALILPNFRRKINRRDEKQR